MILGNREKNCNSPGIVRYLPRADPSSLRPHHDQPSYLCFLLGFRVNK